MNKRLGVGVCLMFLAMTAVRADAATRTVCATGCQYTSLQAAIDAAAYGDTILLRAGETYAGHYTLRAKSGSGTIEIRSDAPASSLPAAGVRLVPSDKGGPIARSSLARIVGLGGAYKTSPLLRTQPGAHGYVLRFLEFDGTAHIGYETLIQIGEDTTVAPSYDITLDRVYVHGHRYKGQKRGITLNARRISVLNSYISDIKSVNSDSQAIAGYNGPGPFTIVNNYLEAAGENMLFGGADPTVANLIPSDIEIRGNHFFKPVAWKNAILGTPGGVRASAGTGGSLSSGTHHFRVVALMATGTRTAVSAPSAPVSATVGAKGRVTVSWSGVSGADKYRVYRGASATSQAHYLDTTATSFAYTGTGEASGSPAASGTKWVVKNVFEVKNGQRITLDGNVFENSWSAGQAGYALMLTPRNSGRAPWSTVRDVTFTNNIVKHVAGIVNVAGYDDSDPTQRTERVTFRNNLFYDVSHTKYGTNAKAILLGDGAATLVFENNTIVHTNTAVVYAYGAAMPGFVYRNNLSLHHTYGIMGQGSTTGNPTLTRFFPGASVRCNVLAGGKASLYPTPNSFPTVADFNAGFVNAAAADYTVRPGSVLAQSGCSGVVPGANIPAVRAATGPGGGTPVEPTPVEPPPPTTNQPPVARAGGPYTATVNGLLSVNGSTSSDPEGGALDARWHWGDEVLVRAADLPASAIRGSEWIRSNQSDAAGGTSILNPNRGAAKRARALASPASYVEFTVNVAANVPYYFWMRMRATSNAYANDSAFVQFSGATNASGAAIARIGSTNALDVILEQGHGAGIAGWGWTDSGWDSTAAPIYFAQGGVQTIRIQAREDGVAWDQIVLSSGAHRTSPGAAKNDRTIVSESFGTSDGLTATHRYTRTGVFPVLLVVADPAGAVSTSATTATVR